MSDVPDPDLDTLVGSDHAQWLALHRDEAAAAEEWLARTLGGRGKRSTSGAPIAGARSVAESAGGRDRDVSETIPSADADWLIQTRSGGVVVARHERSGAVVTGNLVLRVTDDAIRLRLLDYRYEIPADFDAVGPTAPVEAIEHVVNDPATAQSVLDSLGEAATAAAEVPRLRIPRALLDGRRRSDDFYRAIAALARTCHEHKIAYGPRLARDNGVSEGTVRSWVHEARRRGLLGQPGAGNES